MIENAEGPPLLTPEKMREAAALLDGGRGREEVAALLGVDLAALWRHIAPMAGESPPPS